MLASPPAADPIAVANRLRPVLLQLTRELRREIHSLGVTGGQVSLLVQIQREPGLGVRELATRERMSPAGMSKYVGRLEAAGLVERSALADRRRIGLRLTDQDGPRSGVATLLRQRAKRGRGIEQRSKLAVPRAQENVGRRQRAAAEYWIARSPTS